MRLVVGVVTDKCLVAASLAAEHHPTLSCLNDPPEGKKKADIFKEQCHSRSTQSLMVPSILYYARHRDREREREREGEMGCVVVMGGKW